MSWLIFAVHPVNSQAVYAIASYEDVLFFFFGIAALWLVIRAPSAKGMAGAVALLLLSLLSKETGILFVFLAIAYLGLFDRQRLGKFLAMVAIPVAIYLALRLTSVGFASNPNNAPIDKVSVGGRLLNVPSLFAFDIVKMVWPFGQSSSYYWVHSTFTIADTVLPLLFDLGIVGLAVVGGRFVRRNGAAYHFKSYVFFALWCLLGIAVHVQILPLDMTAAEQWLYFPMVGFFATLAVILAVSGALKKPRVVSASAVIASGVLILFAIATNGART